MSALHLCEPHNLCSPMDLPCRRDSGPVQRISLNHVQVILRHKLGHMRAGENSTLFNGQRYNSERALQPFAVPSYRSAFFKEHDEFVGQGYWRGPYPKV